MSIEDHYYTVKITKTSYSYGFDLEEESKPYSKFVIVSKITKNDASTSGLRVGDKIVAINDEKVAGKNYLILKNIIRKSPGDCVKLKILKDADFQMIYPEVLSPGSTFTPMKLSFGRSLIQTGNIREKISLFQNKPNLDHKKTVSNRLSTSCDSIQKYDSKFNANSNSNIQNVASVSADNLMPETNSSDSDKNIIETISQDPFVDDSIQVPQDTIEIQVPFSYRRSIESKSTENLDTKTSVHSFDTVSERISEPFEDWSIQGPEIPKLEMTECLSNYNIHSPFNQLSPYIPINKSRSSNNIFEELNHGWPSIPPEKKNSIEYGSMTNINSTTKMKLGYIRNIFSDRKLVRQESTVANIPIRLRIVQFHDKKKSRGWSDYILEKIDSGSRFRKRNSKGDGMNNFVINFDDVNKFEVDSPHKRLQISSSFEDSNQDSMLKYTLMAINSRVQLRFHFNPAFYHNEKSSKRAAEAFKEIINCFKAAENNKSAHSIDISLSQSSNINASHYESSKSFTVGKEMNSHVDEPNSILRHHSITNSFKGNQKSSAENISSTLNDFSQSSSKSIFKQAIDKIRPDKKVKVTQVAQSYHHFSGTKESLEDFKRQLESGHLPLELDIFDENGSHFNRFIYEVPRMSVDPKIPMVIYMCTEIIENVGLHVEGIYRKSGNKRVIQILTNTLNKPLDEIDTNLPEWKNIHAVCGTFKLFLRKLKQNLIPADLSRVLAYSCKGVDCFNATSLAKSLMDIRYHLSSYKFSNRGALDSNMMDEIDCRWQSLRYILKHLSKIVSFHEYNSMDEHAVSICFNPVLMESWQKSLKDIKADNDIMVKALELILVHQDWLFDNWHSEKDCSWSHELVEDAQRYATEYIDKKYDFNIKLIDSGECEETKEFDVNDLVRRIISQSTMRFGEKNKPKRRHSSHTPGEKPVILRDAIDGQERFVSRRCSRTTDDLDIFNCKSWNKQYPTVPVIAEQQEFKMLYIPSTDPTNDVFESSGFCEHYFDRQISLLGRDKRYAVDYGDSGKDSVTNSSQQSIDSDNQTWQRL